MLTLMPWIKLFLPLKRYFFSLDGPGRGPESSLLPFGVCMAISGLMMTSLTLPRNLGKLWLPSSRTCIPRGRGTCSGKRTGEAPAWASGWILGSWDTRLSLIRRVLSHTVPCPCPCPVHQPFWALLFHVPDGRHQSSPDRCSG